MGGREGRHGRSDQRGMSGSGGQNQRRRGVKRRSQRMRKRGRGGRMHIGAALVRGAASYVGMGVGVSMRGIGGGRGCCIGEVCGLRLCGAASGRSSDGECRGSGREGISALWSSVSGDRQVLSLFPLLQRLLRSSHGRSGRQERGGRGDGLVRRRSGYGRRVLGRSGEWRWVSRFEVFVFTEVAAAAAAAAVRRHRHRSQLAAVDVVLLSRGDRLRRGGRR